MVFAMLNDPEKIAFKILERVISHDCVTQTLMDDSFGDVHVEHIEGMVYRAWVETKNGAREVHVPRYRDKPNNMPIAKWANKMSFEELEVATQVYYDIWNFQDGAPLYREMHEAFDDALKRKRRGNIGQMRLVTDTMLLQVFDGKRWVDMDVPHTAGIGNDGTPHVEFELEKSTLQVVPEGFCFRYDGHHLKKD